MGDQQQCGDASAKAVIECLGWAVYGWPVILGLLTQWLILREECHLRASFIAFLPPPIFGAWWRTTQLTKVHALTEA